MMQDWAEAYWRLNGHWPNVLIMSTKPALKVARRHKARNPFANNYLQRIG